MKQIKFGNILKDAEGIIVHGCNALGVMGSGIALQIKQAYPECFELYANDLKTKRADGLNPLGTFSIFNLPGWPTRAIINAITQDQFGKDASRKYVSYKAISDIFSDVAVIAQDLKLTVNYPLIGCGLGGGDWAIVSSLIDQAFSKHPDIDHTLWIYE